jgi:hypothetical protein
LQKQRCGKVGINSVILGNCGKKSEWKLVQNAAGDLALCPSYTLFLAKNGQMHIWCRTFFLNEGFTFLFCRKETKAMTNRKNAFYAIWLLIETHLFTFVQKKI